MGCHLVELYVWHHREPQGRGLQSPGYISERRGQYHVLAHAGPPGVFVDPANVPLQWLVFPVVNHRNRWNACLPTQRDSKRYLRRHR